MQWSHRYAITHTFEKNGYDAGKENKSEKKKKEKKRKRKKKITSETNTYIRLSGFLFIDTPMNKKAQLKYGH